MQLFNSYSPFSCLVRHMSTSCNPKKSTHVQYACMRYSVLLVVQELRKAIITWTLTSLKEEEWKCQRVIRSLLEQAFLLFAPLPNLTNALFS